MSTHNSELVRFVPTPKSLPGYVDQLDKAGETILQLVDKAAGLAEQNSSRALTMAQKFSDQLRAAEGRIAELETESATCREGPTERSNGSTQFTPRLRIVSFSPAKAVAACAPEGVGARAREGVACPRRHKARCKLSASPRPINIRLTRVSVSDKKHRKRDPKERRPLSEADDYARAFIHPIDNADNLERAYIKSLENLPAAARKRFFEGDEVEGALWSSASRDEHCTLASPRHWSRGAERYFLGEAAIWTIAHRTENAGVSPTSEIRGGLSSRLPCDCRIGSSLALGPLAVTLAKNS